MDRQEIVVIASTNAVSFPCVGESISIDKLLDNVHQISGNASRVAPQNINPYSKALHLAVGLSWPELQTYEKPFKKLNQLRIFVEENEYELVNKLYSDSSALVLDPRFNEIEQSFLRQLDAAICTSEHRIKYTPVQIPKDKRWYDATERHLEDFQKYGTIVANQQNKTPSDGFLAVRYDNYMIITRTQVNKNELRREDLSLVTKIEGDKVYFQGPKPSSEVRTAWEIFQQYPCTHIIHSHNDKITYDSRLIHLVSEWKPYGTKELRDAALKTLIKGYFAWIWGDHGQGVIGNSFDDCLEKLHNLL